MDKQEIRLEIVSKLLQSASAADFVDPANSVIKTAEVLEAYVVGSEDKPAKRGRPPKNKSQDNPPPPGEDKATQTLLT